MTDVAGSPPNVLELVACSVDCARGVAWPRVGGEPRELTTREADLLRHLVGRPSQVVSRDELLGRVWGYRDTVVSRACDNTIRRLREKIEEDPARPHHVLTVHGSGYRFEPLVGAAPIAITPGPTPSTTPAARTPADLVLGDATVDLARRTVTRPGGVAELSSLEVALLQRLLRAEGDPVDRAALLRDVWQAPATSHRAVDSLVVRLRRKLEADPDHPRFLQTVRGGGYRLEPPVDPTPARDDVGGPLFGRAALAGAVGLALDTRRTVLLLGPAGIGKTRLARKVASERSPVAWAELAGVATGDDLVRAVGKALSLELTDADPAARLCRVLAARGGLVLVLDDLDAVAAAAGPFLAAWRATAPQLRILATSRVRVDVDDEDVVDVGPLEGSAATELFVHRARAASRAYRLRPEDEEVVRALVGRLEGVPLAIELAAARTPVLSATALLDHLTLDLLARKGAGSDARHRSLRAALATSWDALAPEHRQAALALSLFTTGFGADDALGLLGPDGIDLAQELRDRSILHTEHRGDAVRLRMWESIRAFADERRAEHPDARAIERRHCVWLSRLGATEHLARLACAGHERETDEQIASTGELAAAARLALGLGEVGLAFRCAAGALWHLRHIGPARHGLALCADLLEADLDEATRGHVLAWRGRLHKMIDEVEAADEDFAESMRIAARHGADAVTCEAGMERCLLAVGRSDLATARECAEAILAAARRNGNGVVAELAHFRLATFDERHADAVEALTRCLELARREGKHRIAAAVHEQLGAIAITAGRLGEASRRLDAALEARAAGRWSQGRSTLVSRRLMVMLDTGDHDGLDRLVVDALRTATDAGSPLDEAAARALWSRSLLVRGRVEDARAQLWQAKLIFERFPRPMAMAQVEAWAAEIHLAAGDRASAHASAVRACELVANLGDPRARAESEAVRALVEAADGDLASARARLEQGVPLLAASGSPRNLAIALGRLGAVVLAAGDAEAAQRHLADARAAAARSGADGPGTEVGVILGALERRLTADG